MKRSFSHPVHPLHPCWLLLLALAAVTNCSCQRADDARPRVRIRQQEWTVELALTAPVRQHGMAQRDSVPPGTGMLFVFRRPERLSFHMLNCRTALDLVFISSSREVISVWTMPVEDDPAHPKMLYDSGHPAQYALEVGGGELAKAGVKAGDRVELLGAARTAVKDAR